MIVRQWSNKLGWDVGNPADIEAGNCAQVAKCDRCLLVTVPVGGDVVQDMDGRKHYRMKYRSLRVPLGTDPMMAVMACNLDGEIQYE
jgi:hypothetical protein